MRTDPRDTGVSHSETLDYNRVLIAVGIPGGRVPEGDNSDAASGLVSVGGRLLSVDQYSYSLWEAALKAPTLRQLLGWARKERISNGDSLLDDLCDHGAISSIPATPQGKDGFAAKHKLVLIGRCQGLSEDGRLLITSALGDGRVAVDRFIYDLLLRGAAPSLLAACTAATTEGSSRVAWFVGEPLFALIRAGIILIDRSAVQDSDGLA